MAEVLHQLKLVILSSEKNFYKHSQHWFRNRIISIILSLSFQIQEETKIFGTSDVV